MTRRIRYRPWTQLKGKVVAMPRSAGAAEVAAEKDRTPQTLTITRAEYDFLGSCLDVLRAFKADDVTPVEALLLNLIRRYHETGAKLDKDEIDAMVQQFSTHWRHTLEVAHHFVTRYVTRELVFECLGIPAEELDLDTADQPNQPECV